MPEPDMTHLKGLIEAEFGSDFTPYLNGFTSTIGAAVAGGCFQPAWLALALEVGMKVALRDAQFATKLVDGIGYGRQLIGQSEGTEMVEQLVEILLSGKANHTFGRLPED